MLFVLFLFVGLCGYVPIVGVLLLLRMFVMLLFRCGLFSCVRLFLLSLIFVLCIPVYVRSVLGVFYCCVLFA